MQYYSENAGSSDKFQVVDVYMRPENTFLQGLYYEKETDLFWEGSGMWGESKVRYLKLDPETKQLNYVATVPQFNMDRNIFGEGIAPLNDNQIVVLTWQSGIVYVLGTDLKLQKTIPLFSGAKEGWGITEFSQGEGHTNFGLYVSDGSSNIQVVDGDTFKTIRTIAVTDENGSPVNEINELEYVNGLIYANIWFQDYIVAINPVTGKVTKRWDMKSLKAAEKAYQRETGKLDLDVLNGIAYNPEDDTFYITGKRWHLMFKVKLN